MSVKDMDIDAILAEFSEYSRSIGAEEAKPEPAPVIESIAEEAAPAEEIGAEYAEEAEVYEEDEYIPEEGEETETPDTPDDEEDEPMPAPLRTNRYEYYEDDEDEYEDEDDDETAPLHVSGVSRWVLGIVFSVITALALIWVCLSFSLDNASAAVSASRPVSNYNLASKVDTFTNHSVADALGDLAYIKKIYTISPTDTVAPAPNPACYGKVSLEDAAQVEEIIDKARRCGLLDGQEVIFSADADFYWDSDIQYYFDETILAICWKEKIDGRVCSCVEVKLADGSQIRRKLVNDTFGAREQAYASEIAASCNAVTAMNADYYAFRDLGICVYQGQITRYDTRCDVLFIDSKGNFSILTRDELGSREDTEKYIADNDIQFSIAFGPILIRDGEIIKLEDSYNGLGEMFMEYSRAGIAQFDDLHYLYMTVSHSNDKTPRCTVNQFAQLMATKNVKTAYNFDGGQTGEVVFNGEPYNHIDFGNERLVSDIIYFATAIPEDQR